MKHCRHFFCSHLGKLGYFPLSLQYYVFNTVRGVFSLLLCVFNTVNSPFQTYWSIWTVEYHKVQVACSTSHIMGINPSEGVMIVTRCVILGATKLLCASSKLVNFQILPKFLISVEVFSWFWSENYVRSLKHGCRLIEISQPVRRASWKDSSKVTYTRG